MRTICGGTGSSPLSFHTVLSSLLSACQVAIDDVQTLVYLDCTKFGIMTQPEVNAVGDLVQKIIMRNPFRSST